MKNYRAQTPQYLALAKIFAKFQENEHIPGNVKYSVATRTIEWNQKSSMHLCLRDLKNDLRKIELKWIDRKYLDFNANKSSYIEYNLYQDNSF